MQDFATFNLIDTAHAISADHERTFAANRHSLEYRRLIGNANHRSFMHRILAGPAACGHAARKPAASAG